MSKGGGKTVQTVQDTSPWAAQQPYLQNLFSRANSLYGQPTVAAQSPFTQQAIQRMGAEAGPGSLTSQAQDQYRKTIGGDYLDLSKNPAAMYAMDAARSKINTQFQGDNYGNSAHREWLGKGLMEAASPFYQMERSNQLNAAQAAPSMAAAGFAPLQQAGQMQDQYQQRLMDSPWESLQRYQGAVAGNYGGARQGTQPYNAPNDFLNAAGLGLAAYGMFSDRRLKTDVNRIGTHRSGVSLYSFKYVGDSTPRIGVMADEVAKVKPEAVGERDGYLTVNYAMLER